MEIKLKGWKAIAVLVVIAVVVVGKYRMERATLETGATEEIKLYLRGEYTSLVLKGVDTDRMTAEELQAKGEELLKLEDIQFTSVKARGSGDDIVVRVEVQVSGRDPPDGKRVRYYRMSHSTVTGWQVRGEITALSYYLKVF